MKSEPLKRGQGGMMPFLIYLKGKDRIVLEGWGRGNY